MTVRVALWGLANMQASLKAQQGFYRNTKDSEAGSQRRIIETVYFLRLIHPRNPSADPNSQTVAGSGTAEALIVPNELGWITPW